jgi:hypothetical protein
MKLTLNYEKLPILGVAFSHSKDVPGYAIAVVRGGIGDDAFPIHALLITADRGQKFATEETLAGLVENSLEEYTTDLNRLVGVFYWHGWDDAAKKESAQDDLAYIRRKHAENSQYDFGGLFVFVKEKLPSWLQWMIPAKADKTKQWCSENCLAILDKYGFASGWTKDRGPAPDELMEIMMKRDDVELVLNYYLYPEQKALGTDNSRA